MQHEEDLAVGALSEDLKLRKVLDACLLCPLGLHFLNYVFIILISLLKRLFLLLCGNSQQGQLHSLRYNVGNRVIVLLLLQLEQIFIILIHLYVVIIRHFFIHRSRHEFLVQKFMLILEQTHLATYDVGICGGVNRAQLVNSCLSCPQLRLCCFWELFLGVLFTGGPIT